MQSGVHIYCFAASYAAALAIEALGAWRHLPWRRRGVVAATGAGIVAHTWYLGERVAATPGAALVSPHDWYLSAAWLLAAITLAATFYYPSRSLGVFLLPAVLALIAASLPASADPVVSNSATRFWSRLHAGLLMLGSLAVLIGFLSGLMYLLQSWRLKRKAAPLSEGFRLPSMEWLEKVNGRALPAAAVLVGLGFLTGVIVRWSQADARGGVPWTDPVVLSLGVWVLWLLVAEGFRLLYPAARGQKVAYLSVATFALLVLTLAAFTLTTSLHGEPAAADVTPGDAAGLLHPTEGDPR